MSTFRHPSRLSDHSDEDIVQYPRELSESDGILYIKNDDGSETVLNKTEKTYIKDSSGTIIGTVDPETEGNISIPDATSTQSGFVKFSTTAPVVASTANVGTATTVSRSDHVHPAQTTVSGNAGTATTLATARTIQTNLASTSSASFNGSANITPGVTGTLPIANGGTGANTAAGAKTALGITDTDTKVLQSSSTTSNYRSILLGYSNNSSASGLNTSTTNQVYATNYLYCQPSTGNLISTGIITSGGFVGNLTGNATNATTLATSRTVQVNLASTSSASFNGSANITPGVTGTLGLANGGTGNTTGLAATATALATARTVQTNLASTSSASFNGSANITPGVTGTLPIANGGTGANTAAGALTAIGAAASSHGTHVTYSTTAPVIAGTANVGSASTVSRSDHVHPAQTTVSGNAGTATTLATARTVQVNLASTSSASFNGSANITPGVTGILGLANGGTGNITGLAASATKLATARTISITGAASGSTSFDGTEDSSINLASIDGSMITGTIPLTSIPKGAQEQLFLVDDDTARLALTIDNVQNGDVVKVESTGLMYYISDDSLLGTEDAFCAFTSGTASAVDWSGITNRPTFATVATSGSYNDLSDTPDIPEPSTTVPIIAGTGTVGSSSNYALADHVHPAQTTVSGNAGTATTLATARTVQVNLASTSSASFNGSANITPGVTGTLGLANGGTGANTAAGALTALGAAASEHGTHVTYSTTVPVVASTANVGSASTVSRSDHVHPAQTTITGNAATATTLSTARTVQTNLASTSSASFNGSANITPGVTGTLGLANGGTGANTAAGALTALGAAASEHGTHVTYSTTAPVIAGTANVGSASTVSRSDHVHPAQTTITGNAATATTLATARTVQVNLASTSSASFNGSANITPGVTGTLPIASGGTGATTAANALTALGAAASSHGTHVTYSTTVPVIAGTANVGTATTVSRSDHVHPAQTTITGNAGTATKLATSRTIQTNLASTSSASFNGSANITPGVTGTLGLANGGTGATSASAALTSLGAASSSHTHSEYQSKVSLIGQVQQTSYRRSVIALCKLSSASNTCTYSYSSGVIMFKRTNAVTSFSTCTINMEDKYGSIYTPGCSIINNLGGTNSSTTAYSIRPCTFKYNGGYYGGIEFYLSAAESAYVYFSGITNFSIFGLDWYATNTSTVINTEISESINYDNIYYYTGGLQYNNGNYLATTATYTATVDTSWTYSSSGYYYNTATVTGILSTDSPIVDISLSTYVSATADLYLDEYSKIYRIVTSSNTITLYASSATTLPLTLSLKCIRTN